jgi:ferrochelatase
MRQVRPPHVNTGILLVNTGTPQASTVHAIRTFLAEFLSDKRVIRLPRWLWLPLLHFIILRVRPGLIASKYQEIWTDGGSPLLRDSFTLADGLERKLQGEYGVYVGVEVGMRYGQPSIRDGLKALHDWGAQRLVILPLFPQYSDVTVASVYDIVFDEVRRWPQVPEVKAVRGYHNQPGYIRAITRSIEAHCQAYGKPDFLLFSYHGIPLSYAATGDSYPEHCTETTERIVAQLGLRGLQFETSFQSRFGPQAWTQPYTDAFLTQKAQNGGGRMDVICPGFAIDCLETLHEIEIEGHVCYLNSGGEDLRYIPALNSGHEHVELLAEIIHHYLDQPWEQLSTKNTGDEE